MTFSFCLNKTDVLVVCGMSLLYQTMALKHNSMLSRDGQKSVNEVIKLLYKAKAPGALDFKSISGMILTVDEMDPPTPPESSPGASSSVGSQRGPASSNSPEAQPQNHCGRLSDRPPTASSASETELLQQQAKLRRMTMPSGNVCRPEVPQQQQGRRSFDTNSPRQLARRQRRTGHQTSPLTADLDYPSIGGSNGAEQYAACMQGQGRQHSSGAVTPSQAQRLAQMYQQGGPTADSKMAEFSPDQWESLLGSLDGVQGNVYDAIYGGPSPISLHEPPQQPVADTTQRPGTGSGPGPVQQQTATAAATRSAWPEEPWHLSGFSLSDFDGAARTALSMSSDSAASGEETVAADLGPSLNSLDLRDEMRGCNGGGRSEYLTGLENDFMI